VDGAGAIEVVVPWRVSYQQGERFVREKEPWLSDRLQRVAQKKKQLPTWQVVDGATLPFFGGSVRLRLTIDRTRKRTTTARRGGVLLVKTASRVKAQAAVRKWYINESQDYFWGQAMAYALQLGVRVDEVVVRDTKSQWGSCHKGRRALCFQWKLALAPVEIARYVVAHEVAHLKRADHSAAFWRQVMVLDPDYAQHQAWLKEYGAVLDFH